MKKSNQTHLPSESATVVINSLAQKKIAAGIKVYNLSAGEPKLSPHQIIVDAVLEALNQGKTFYPPVSGIPELKSLASAWMNHSFHSQFEAENCLVVNGGKFGIYLLLQLLLVEGDEVIFTSPYWVSYPALTKLFGGIPKIIETEESNSWKMSAADLKQACTSKSKFLILNSACNPTGTIYSKNELSEILKVAHEHGLYVISDEVYSGLIYDSNTYVSCGSFTQYQDKMIIIQSCSKNFSMTGWRIGFVFGPIDIISRLTTLVGQSTSGVTTVSQWAAVAAFSNEKEIQYWVKSSMQKRRDVIISAFQDNFGITINPPASSLYIFLSLQSLGISNMSSAEFCQQALEQANVALVPGSAFGKEGFVRFSFGAEEQDLVAGIKQLSNFIKQ